MSNYETFEDPNIVELPDGRTDFGPNSGVGPEGTLVNLFEQQSRIDKINKPLATIALSNFDGE